MYHLPAFLRTHKTQIISNECISCKHNVLYGNKYITYMYNKHNIWYKYMIYGNNFRYRY